MWRPLTVAVTAVVLLAGCAGSDEETRQLSGGTFPQELGLSLVVDDVEVGGDETSVSVTVRNPSGYTLVLDPSSSALVVDGESLILDRAEFPVLIPYAKGGGGEASGRLVFPSVSADAGSYELHVEGSSENTTLGDNGNVEWNVALVPADDSE